MKIDVNEQNRNQNTERNLRQHIIREKKEKGKTNRTNTRKFNKIESKFSIISSI